MAARRLLAAALACALAGTGAARAAFFEPEGAVETATVVRDLDRYALPTGAYGPEGADARVLVGEVVRRAYRIEPAAPPTEAVAIAARERLEAQGFAILLDCRNRECGGFDFRHEVELLPAPAMLMDSADFAQISARRGGEEPVYVSVLASRVLDRMHVQTVTVRPREGVETAAIPPDPRPDVPGPEIDPPPAIGPSPPAADDPGPVAGAEALLARLRRDGHVSVAGVDFETGGARLSAASVGALDAVAEMLAAEPEIRVVVVGHSDNTGSLETNVALSRQRAQAVRSALVERGIAATRLSAEGVGFLAPVTSNATPQGRARNRRVEIVLR